MCFADVLIDIINKYKSQTRDGLIDSRKIDSVLKNLSAIPPHADVRNDSTSMIRNSVPTSQVASTESRFSLTLSTPNLAKSMPQLTTEKARVFEIFRKEYPGTECIDNQKTLLKEKYAEAKALGEEANKLRCGISKHSIFIYVVTGNINFD